MKDRIKQVRKEYGLTQEEFATRIGIAKSSVSLLESGRNNPSTQTVQLICQQFRVRKDWLLSGEEPMLLPTVEDEILIDAILDGANPMLLAVVKGITKTPNGWEKLREIVTNIYNELEP